MVEKWAKVSDLRKNLWFMGYGRNQSWPNYSYSPGICLGALRKATKNLSQNSGFSDRNLNPRPSEYEARVLTTWFRRSVPRNKIRYNL
jgi:hypothetical protein